MALKEIKSELFDLDSLCSIFDGAAVHVPGVKVLDPPVHPAAHLAAPVLAKLHRGDIGVRVVEADEGCACLGFGVLDHLPVVLGGRYVRLDPCKVDVRGAVALVRVLQHFMGACCHDQVTAKPNGVLGQK